MPIACQRLCCEPGCPRLAAANGRCERHQIAPEKTTAERGYAAGWPKARRYKLAIDPLCERCGKHGMTTAADEVHHIVPIKDAPHLRLEASNLMSVCRPCHEEIERQKRLGGAA